jgi:hypothetical protein
MVVLSSALHAARSNRAAGADAPQPALWAAAVAAGADVLRAQQTEKFGREFGPEDQPLPYKPAWAGELPPVSAQVASPQAVLWEELASAGMPVDSSQQPPPPPPPPQATVSPLRPVHALASFAAARLAARLAAPSITVAPGPEALAQPQWQAPAFGALMGPLAAQRAHLRAVAAAAAAGSDAPTLSASADAASLSSSAGAAAGAAASAAAAVPTTAASAAVVAAISSARAYVAGISTTRGSSSAGAGMTDGPAAAAAAAVVAQSDDGSSGGGVAMACRLARAVQSAHAATALSVLLIRGAADDRTSGAPSAGNGVSLSTAQEALLLHFPPGAALPASLLPPPLTHQQQQRQQQRPSTGAGVVAARFVRGHGPSHWVLSASAHAQSGSATPSLPVAAPVATASALAARAAVVGPDGSACGGAWQPFSVVIHSHLSAPVVLRTSPSWRLVDLSLLTPADATAAPAASAAELLGRLTQGAQSGPQLACAVTVADLIAADAAAVGQAAAAWPVPAALSSSSSSSLSPSSSLFAVPSLPAVVVGALASLLLLAMSETAAAPTYAPGASAAGGLTGALAAAPPSQAIIVLNKSVLATALLVMGQTPRAPAPAAGSAASAHESSGLGRMVPLLTVLLWARVVAASMWSRGASASAAAAASNAGAVPGWGVVSPGAASSAGVGQHWSGLALSLILAVPEASATAAAARAGMRVNPALPPAPLSRTPVSAEMLAALYAAAHPAAFDLRS